MPAIRNQNDWDHIFLFQQLYHCVLLLCAHWLALVYQKRKIICSLLFDTIKNMCYKKREIECEKLSSLSALPRLCSVIRI